MIEVTFVLLLVMGGERIEYTPYQSLSECLAVKRKLNGTSATPAALTTKWSCKELKVKLQDGHIVGFVEE